MKKHGADYYRTAGTDLENQTEQRLLSDLDVLDHNLKHVRNGGYTGYSKEWYVAKIQEIKNILKNKFGK